MKRNLALGRNGAPRGEYHHAAKLTEDKVRELRGYHYERGLCVKCSCAMAEVPYRRGMEAILFYTWRHVR